MGKRIKVFTNNNPYDVEHSVNLFLENQIGKLHDVLWDVAADLLEEGILEYSAVIVFTPEEGEGEKENQNSKENEKGDARVQRGGIALGKQNGTSSKIPLPSCCNWALRSTQGRS